MQCMNKSKTDSLNWVHWVSRLFLADIWMLGLDPRSCHHSVFPYAAGMGYVRLTEFIFLLPDVPVVLPVWISQKQ